MACDREVQLLLSCYVDGEATPSEAARAKAHLESCPGCREMVEDWQGQRSIFEWTYRVAVSEEVETASFGERPWEGEAMESGKKAPRRPMAPRWNWATAGGLALAAGLALFAWHLATLPPMLGASVVTGSRAQTVRMGDRGRLTVGPGSKILCSSSDEIELVAGWVRAEVTHGPTPFHVRTKQIDVEDLGTRFEVGTSSQMDYVAVEEGSVSVRKGGSSQSVGAGRKLIAVAGLAPQVVTPPDAAKADTDPGGPIYSPSGRFTPTDGSDLDWDAGMKRLSQRFPDARKGAGRAGGWSGEGGRIYHHSLTGAPGLTAGLAARFEEIVRGAAGQPTGGRDWEIPVGYTFVDRIVKPVQAEGDYYYIRLMSRNGEVFWQLDGSNGGSARIPLRFGKYGSGEGSGGSSVEGELSSFETIKGRNRPYSPGGGGPRLVVSIVPKDWPGELRPGLVFETEGVSALVDEAAPRAMLAALKAKAPAGWTLDPDSAIWDFHYLDPGRKHRILVVWNQNLGAGLRGWRGNGSETPVALVMTDVAWNSPMLSAGAYLLRLAPRRGGAIPMEVVDLATGKAVALPILDKATKEWANAAGSRSAPGAYGSSQIDLRLSTGEAKGGTFPFAIEFTKDGSNPWESQKGWWFGVAAP